MAVADVWPLPHHRRPRISHRGRWLGASGLALALALSLAVLGWPAALASAAPGICVGPVCGDEITRSALHPWQLRMRINNQMGRHERVVVDCRYGSLSPLQGPVERGYAGAVARRACRLAGEAPG